MYQHYACLLDDTVKQNKQSNPCADPESFVRWGPTLTTFFFLVVGEEKEDPKIHNVNSLRFTQYM